MKFPKWLRVYGDKNYRGPCPPEEAEHITFINTLRRDYPDLSRIAIHPKNEGRRNLKQALEEKALGSLNKGAPDIIIPGKITLLCELKQQNHIKSTLLSGQQEYLLAAHNFGAFTCVALGCDAAIQAVEDWIVLISG